jgi:acyl-CoA thioester hydrolase
MARVKLTLPQTFSFATTLQVRISDINYGNHLSNDAYLKYMHEARLQFFAHHHCSEQNLGEGVSVIMGDCSIVYKAECFYGDMLKIEIAAAEFGSRSFDLYYRFINANTDKIVCEAKTGMVCFNYEKRSTVAVPNEFKNKFIF